MKQKIIWMLFLNIGVIVSVVSCDIRREYLIDADIIYKNDTPYHIRYDIYDDINNEWGSLFEVAPYSTYKKEIRGDGGHKVNTPEIYKGLFGDFQGTNANIIEYNGVKCLIYRKGEGSTTDNYLNSYQWRKISNHYFEFTYTFTEEEAEKATACP